MDKFAYVEPSVDRYAYVEQLYLLLVVSRKEKLEKMDSAVEVFRNDDVITISNVNSNMQQYSAMMVSALLLKESRISNHDVFISIVKKSCNYDVSNISRQLNGSAMMTSAVMSSKSAVDKRSARDGATSFNS
ncbi:hypothetical protein F511_22043 [Dorcoceras hygrometricum]|uniref:Uncharacterized protein n=1 Tax=Dorcoceras hygrometricum TaxID=472368 RepID=A0A2Z7AN16_9LAMI|nr:hypothetical protein F511_22043 [Dorcoceras hygrometricum]